MGKRKPTLFDLFDLFAPSTRTNRTRPPAAQYGFGKKPKRGNVPFIDKPYGGGRR